MADAILAQSGIYVIRNKVNGKVYVGSAIHIKKRWNVHVSSLRRNKHHSIKLQRAWIAYGESSFEFSIIEHVLRKEDLIAREQYWIDQLNSFSIGYNCLPKAGSSLGAKLSNEARANMSASRQNVSEETRRKMSLAHTGVKMPDHVRRILSDAQKGRPKTEEHKKKLSDFRKSFVGWSHSEETKKKIGRFGTENAMYGKTVSEETRAKISESLIGNSYAKGFVHSEETRAKISAAGVGRKHSEETKTKMSEFHKGKVFSDETRLKMSIAAKARRAREKLNAQCK